MKKTLEHFQLINHLGDDFHTQGLFERKRRVDAQIEEHARLFSRCDLSQEEDRIISKTFVQLMRLQKDIASKISLISAICYN
ncbi:hypothetical protein [Sphingobacterium thalpophilum]|uniref:hypothetical protein n=1 Tax=Sphingobacterium thalpophilum TaxID=259 RepID=UPI003D95E548